MLELGPGAEYHRPDEEARGAGLWTWLNSGPESRPQPDTYRVGDADQLPAYRPDGVATGTSPGSIGGSDLL